MDELIEDFLVETKEGLEILDNDLVTLEKDPENKEIIGNVFRVMHTIKGTCGFLGLARLESIAHAGENVMDKVRDGTINAEPHIISAILESVDNIKVIIEYLEQNGSEPEGNDKELISRINSFAEGKKAEPIAPVVEEKPKPSEDGAPAQDSDELQALFDSTPGPADVAKHENKEVHAEVKNAEASKKENPKSDKKHAPSQTIRVSIDILEELMQQVSELVLTRNQLLQILRANNNSSVFSAPLNRLNNITTELQEGVMKTRMQPVGNAWTKLPRLVRDLSMELGKKIDLNMIGEETELDRQLLEMITDPLTHMVRNSADHGIESPEERKSIGKPETGTINLKAYHGGGYIIIEISDDGKGINPEIIKNKAIEKGLVEEHDAENMTDTQIFQFIFAPGFSTAQKVTSVSGRGVGMDVVKNNIEKISGTVDLKSELGKGSLFTIKIPLTLAIMPILQVSVKNSIFAIPQINVLEVVKTGKTSGVKIEYINDTPILRLRGNLLPLVSLSEILGFGEEDYSNEDQSKFIVVCEAGNYHFGVIVDNVHDTEEIVVKPVSPVLKKLEMYSGITILGDGSVILILDPNGLARSSGEAGNSKNEVNIKHHSTVDENLASFIIFKAGDATPKVAPLEIISRLEEIDVGSIEYSRGVPVIQYRGDLMRVTKLDESYNLPEQGLQEMLVVTDGHNTMGLVVEEILDIVKTHLDTKISGGKDGYIGSMVINGKTCDVIDINYHFKQTFSDIYQEEDNPLSEEKISENRLLFVDDSPFFRKFIPMELMKIGYKVDVAASAYEAIDLLEKDSKYSLIVSDINMPGMNGQQFALHCRGDNKLKDIPIIALSANTVGKDTLNEYNLEGFSGFVSKTNHNDLITEIGKVLSSKEIAA